MYIYYKGFPLIISHSCVAKRKSRALHHQDELRGSPKNIHSIYLYDDFLLVTPFRNHCLMRKERTRIKHGEDYNDSALTNMIGVKQMCELIEVRTAWVKGGRCVIDPHPEVIRRLFDQGVSESMLCQACRQKPHMPDGSDSGEGWGREDRQGDTRGVIAGRVTIRSGAGSSETRQGE
jgi:hypothetical protein